MKNFERECSRNIKEMEEKWNSFLITQKYSGNQATASLQIRIYIFQKTTTCWRILGYRILSFFFLTNPTILLSSWVVLLSFCPFPFPSSHLPFLSSVEDSGFIRFYLSLFFLLLTFLVFSLRFFFFLSFPDINIMLIPLHFSRSSFHLSSVFLPRHSLEAALRSTFNWMDRSDIDPWNALIRATMGTDQIFWRIGCSLVLCQHISILW